MKEKKNKLSEEAKKKKKNRAGKGQLVVEGRNKKCQSL